MNPPARTKPEPDSTVFDLTSCDREPIHILGGIQPFGFLVAVAADWIVNRASGNVADFLGHSAEDLLGASLESILSGEAVHTIRGRLQGQRGPGTVEQLLGVALRDGGPCFDLAIHQSGASIVIEAEPSLPEDVSAANLVRGMVGRLQDAGDFDAFCREAVRQVRALTHFDRVMIYRFDDDGAGEVIAESVRSSLPPYLGLHYPASDIPSQARLLYERSWVRIIADVDADAVPVEPRLDPAGQPLDLSMGMLRSVSPIHLEYLRNMGVAASLSISIMRRGRLWGLFACHHMQPRRISLERRTAADLFGQMFSLTLESREHAMEAAYEARAQDMHNQLMTTMAAGDLSIESVSEVLEELSRLVSCDGIGISIDGSIALRGMTPTREEFLGIVRYLHRTPPSRSFVTREIGRFYKPGSDFTERAAGLMAIPISRTPRDYVVFFRREVARTVTWAGNPEKPVTIGPNGIRLTPRKSFEAWREIVRGQCIAWSAADLRIGESLRVTLLEVILRLTDSAERDRRSSQQRQELLVAELNHRVRNILVLIRGVVSKSRGGAQSIEHFATVISGRIQALARAHDQITKTNWAPSSLRDLILSEAGAYLGDKAERLRLQGTDMLLAPAAFSTLAMVLHELITNSAKYGALGSNNGRVEVGWAPDPLGRLVIDWREIGGPAVLPPARRGFGTTIIERSIPHELQGEAHVRYELTGVEVRLVLPAAIVQAAPTRIGAGTAATTSAETPPFTLSGTVLLVEDNLIIALDTEEMLQTLGATRVETVSSVNEALRLLAEQRPALALLDMNLGNETSLPVAEELLRMGVPFVFATGYGDSINLPLPLATVSIIQKPFTVEILKTSLALLIAHP